MRRDRAGSAPHRPRAQRRRVRRAAALADGQGLRRRRSSATSPTSTTRSSTRPPTRAGRGGSGPRPTSGRSRAAYDALGVLPPSAEPRATGHITQIVELIERLIDARPRLRRRRRRLLRRAELPATTASCPDTGSTTCTRARAWRPASATSATSRCGRAPSRASRRGRRRGAGAGPAGTPNASRCARRISGPSSTSTPAEWTWSSRTTRTRSRRPCAAGDGFAQYWLHNGWVTMGGEKMSKSLGNVLAIPAVLQRVRPAELRYYLGSAHYRSMLEFSETALQDAAKAYTGIEEFLHRVRSRVGAVVPGDLDAEVRRGARRRPGGARRAGRGARRARRGQPGAGRRRPRRRDGAGARRSAR